MTSTSFDPRTGAVVGTAQDTTRYDVLSAAARAAEAAPHVESSPPATRRRWLHAVADALDGNAGELVRLADSETGLGLPRLEGEIARTANQLRFYGDVAAEGSFLGATIDSATETFPAVALVNRFLGPVAVFGASNFPFAFSVLGNDTASAIAAGCPVIAKAHPAHLCLSLRLAEVARDALRSAGAPDSVFDLVVGFEAGSALVTAPEISAVAFTGSQGGGLALWRLANERAKVIPVYAEMGTVNPVIVTRATVSAGELAAVAEGFVGSFTLGSGQYCTKPGLLLAPAGSGAAAIVGQALSASGAAPVMLTEQIAQAVRTGIADLCAAGAELVHATAAQYGGWSAPAAVLSVQAADLLAGGRLLEEVFGAVVVVAEYSDDEELFDILAALQGCLAAAVMATRDDPDAAAYVARLSSGVGRVTVNDWPTGVAYVWAQHHGGPWPSTTDPTHTSVGANALNRFVRPVAYQSVPDAWLPPALQAENPWRLGRRLDGRLVPTAPGRGMEDTASHQEGRNDGDEGNGLPGDQPGYRHR
jgi:NADP-dependent aldehyde dehydrogenase